MVGTITLPQTIHPIAILGPGLDIGPHRPPISKNFRFFHNDLLGIFPKTNAPRECFVQCYALNLPDGGAMWWHMLGQKVANGLLPGPGAGSRISFDSPPSWTCLIAKNG